VSHVTLPPVNRQPTHYTRIHIIYITYRCSRADTIETSSGEPQTAAARNRSADGRQQCHTADEDVRWSVVGVVRSGSSVARIDRKPIVCRRDVPYSYFFHLRFRTQKSQPTYMVNNNVLFCSLTMRRKKIYNFLILK
jgi:hypothetical protein